MSNDANRKAPLDPATQVAEETRARLRTLPQDQLVDLCAQLLSTYVVEGVLPLARAGEGSDLAADSAGEETFAQMLKRLNATRRDAVLDRFVVDGENISVREREHLQPRAVSTGACAGGRGNTCTRAAATAASSATRPAIASWAAGQEGRAAEGPVHPDRARIG
jgi:hypothetical protein